MKKNRKTKIGFSMLALHAEGLGWFFSGVACHIRIMLRKSVTMWKSTSGNYFSVQFKELVYYENRNTLGNIHLVSIVVIYSFGWSSFSYSFLKWMYVVKVGWVQRKNPVMRCGQRGSWGISPYMSLTNSSWGRHITFAPHLMVRKWKLRRVRDMQS